MKLSGDSAVASKISGVEAKSVRVAPSTNAPRRHDQADTNTAGVADTGADVQLTDTARDMAAVEQSLHSLPAVNDQRVAAVKSRLESGEYRIDPQRIADKLLHMESDLQRTNPREHSSLK